MAFYPFLLKAVLGKRAYRAGTWSKIAVHKSPCSAYGSLFTVYCSRLIFNPRIRFPVAVRVLFGLPGGAVFVEDPFVDLSVAGRVRFQAR